MVFAANQSTKLASAPGAIIRFFRMFRDALTTSAQNDPKMRQLALLASLSDEELAAKGLTREDIGLAVVNASGWL